MSSSGERYNWWSEDDRWPENDRWQTDGLRLLLTFVCITYSLQVRADDGQTVIDWWSEDDYSPYLFPDVRINHLQFTSTYRPAHMYRQQQMTGRRRMTDRRSLSGSLNVTAGSGIRDSEGGATKTSKFQNVLGGTTECMKRLAIDTKGCVQLTSKDTFFDDSWFSSVKTSEEMAAKGVNYCGTVKTSHKGFCLATLKSWWNIGREVHILFWRVLQYFLVKDNSCPLGTSTILGRS